MGKTEKDKGKDKKGASKKGDKVPKILKAGAGGGKAKKKVENIINNYRNGQRLNQRRS